MSESKPLPEPAVEPGEARETLDTVLRRTAKSGKVSYADPVILHETSRSRVSFIPTLQSLIRTIPSRRRNCYGTEGAATDGLRCRRQEFSVCRYATARRLLQTLRTHLKVAESDQDGEFIIIRAAEGTANLNAHDPALVARALAKVLSEPEIAKHLEGVELSREFVSAFRGAIRLREMAEAVAALRQHLEAEETDERIYQEWCERHTWAFGNAYVVRDEINNI